MECQENKSNSLRLIDNIQGKFLRDLGIFMNGSIFSNLDLFFSVLSPLIPITRHSQEIINKYKSALKYFSQNEEAPLKSHLINIDYYQGGNPSVYKMINYLTNNLKDDLFGAYVHGSLGTYEEIPYSDFDALVVIKNDIFKSKERLIKVAQKLNFARSIMFEFDPLQHHGWFVFTENDFRFHPEQYFPHELFHHAKSLFPDEGLRLTLNLQKSGKKIMQPFNALCDSITLRVSRGNYPQNLYQLKSLLSQFMLLPALYVQAKEQKGIFKKFSFVAAKKDFSTKEWLIMDEISEIRRNWTYTISPFQKQLIKGSNPAARYFAKQFAPAVPANLKEIFDEKLFLRMKNLAESMKEKIK